MPDSWGARRRLLVVVDDRSREGRTVLDDAFARLERGGLTVVPEICPAGTDISEAVRRYGGDVQAVIVAGGDAILNAAAAGLMDTGLPLGILPLGGANTLARALGLPLDPVEAAGVVAAGHRRRIDIGAVNGHYFFSTASLGLSVELARALGCDVARRRGRLDYAIAALRATVQGWAFKAEIRAGDKSSQVTSVQIAVANSRHGGGGPMPEAAGLDVCSLEPRRLWRIMLMRPAIHCGRHDAWREVRALSGAEIEIRTRRRQPISTDGVLRTHTPARFSVVPRAITVFAPAPEVAWPPWSGQAAEDRWTRTAG